jgi:hypothetical protein
VMSLLDSAANIVWKRTYNSTWTLSRIVDEKLFNNSCYFLVADNDFGLSNIHKYYKLNDTNDSTVYTSYAEEDFCLSGDKDLFEMNSNIYTYEINVRRSDTLLNTLWTSSFSDTTNNGLNEYYTYAIVAGKDSTLLVGGSYKPVMGNTVGYLLKVDMITGNSIYSVRLNSGRVTKLINTIDGGYAAILVDSTINLIKIDSSLNIQWTKNFPGFGVGEAASLEQTLDDGYLICGYTFYNFNTDSLYPYLIKTDINGDAPAVLMHVDESSKPQINIYPNPMNESARISGVQYPLTVNIYDQSGRLIDTQILNSRESLLERRGIANGIYFVNIHYTKGLSFRMKLLID